MARTLARGLAAAALAALLLVCAAAPVSIKALPKSVDVTVHLKDGGAVCTSMAVGAPCMTKYNAVKDSIHVSYTATPVKGAKSVSLYACYSKKSTYDRPWRKPTDNPKTDKSCLNLIKKGLPVASGSAQWTPNAETPTATFYVRAYQMCAGPNGPVACATGVSKGFFQVVMENQIPKDLLGAAIGCMFVGPLCLAAYVGFATMSHKKGHN